MFKKVLIANRGEIAVRILRTCHDMGIKTVAVYQAQDYESLHVRLADECVQLNSDEAYTDQDTILQIALQSGADAIHPGYSYLSEQVNFVRTCESNGITFIGPGSDVLINLQNRMEVVKKTQSFGITTPLISSDSYRLENWEELIAEARRFGYPLVIKSLQSGFGQGAWFVKGPELLDEIYLQLFEQTSDRIENSYYLEQAITPSNQVRVQILADQFGRLIHLGERDGSLNYGNQKLVEESPSPRLNPSQRVHLYHQAIEIARFFHFENVGSIEFLIDRNGNAYFTEIKSSLQIGHPVTELISGIDLVEQQIRIAAGESLAYQQEEVNLKGWAIQCRIAAVDPWEDFLPRPGSVQHVRLPAGNNVRVDSYLHCGCNIPMSYDPTLAKISAWGGNREECIRRIRRALGEFYIAGMPTNLSLFNKIFKNQEFLSGEYTTNSFGELMINQPDSEEDNQLRDLAVAAAVKYLRQKTIGKPTVPDRLLTSWHRESRRFRTE
jgi:acetyl-CoA carboxylase biotin carboxylase subunit